MVGIQFIMTMSFSFLSPIMPLFLPDLGVTTDAGIDLWSGILNGSTSFVAAFASPLWGRLADQLRPQADAAALELRDRGVHRVDGHVAERLAVLRRPRADGRVRRLLLHRDGAGGKPGAGAAARLRTRPAQHRPAGRLAGGAGDRRRAGRPHRQLPHPVLLHIGHHLRLGVRWSGAACTSTSCGRTARIAGAPECAAWR